ncbi:cytochrome P450 [Novosphingobium kaempferiae]|uniref:cytochrome P450 n=1 Tax=Novosphingobium kaempferiae TaxID=2896849 RepID=UPI001E4F4ECC|nr:cytochrome P450 [Novosphingobium kaempferiae]
MPQSRTLDDIRVDFDAPDNVPKDRIVDLSFANGSEPNDLVDPYEPFAWLNGEDIPRLLFNPPARYGLGAISGRQQGNWVVSHYADIERVYTDNEHFSNAGTAEFQRLIGETFKSIPLAIDPPDHQKYRLYLMPYFSPARITRELEPRIREVVVEMIDAVADKGEVDMAWDFARVYPVRIFMGLMGFPAPMFEQFLDWEWDILHSGSLEKMQAALRGVLDFLRGFIAEKEREPDEHLVSAIVHGRIEGRAPTDDEKIGMVWFLWLGGLDTVAATIAQMFRRMALQPEIQRTIRERPELINGAVEEFLRTQPILSSARTATKDFEWHGIQVRAGDSFQCLNPAGNFDPAQFTDPRTFDPERKANRHFTFVGGVHICLGAHLARRELRLLLEEWFRRVPEFRPKPGADTSVFPGLLSIRNLPLVWDTASSRT